jgi:DNA-binding CsgD family transcriptional regulator
VSIDDPLVRDLVHVRARRLGLGCELAAGGLVVSPDEDGEVTSMIVRTVDAEALDVCGRDGVVGMLTWASPSMLLDLLLADPPADGLVLDPEIAARLARRVSRAEPLGASTGLTAREEEILRLLAGGLPLKQVATQLGITSKTVENHATKLYAKLGVRNRREAVVAYGAVAPTDPGDTLRPDPGSARR